MCFRGQTQKFKLTLGLHHLQVTGHDSSGNAIIIKDSEIECKPTPIKCNFAVLWETSTFPSDNNDDRDPAESKTESLVNENGVILRVVDFPPKTETVSTSLPKLSDSDAAVSCFEKRIVSERLALTKI